MKNCIVCGKEFEPANPKGVFCSGACKMKAARAKAKGDNLPTPADNQPAKEIPSNTDANKEFNMLLAEFEKLFKAGKRLHETMQELIRKVTDNKVLLMRQKEAIIGRCKSAIKGKYGETKRPEHFKHSGLV